MKSIYRSLLFAASMLFLWQCDKVDDPFPTNDNIADSNIVWDDSVTSNSNNGVRYVLMEEFTGHLCSNCPTAAKEIQRIKNDFYHEKFIPIAIHATQQFAAPQIYPGAPSGSYQSDYRTPESEEYESEPEFFVLAGLPRGMVNRKPRGQTKDKWKATTDGYFTNPGLTIANIDITNFYDDSSKTFKVRVTIEWLQTPTVPLMLQVQMLEDNIINWQLDNSQHIDSQHVENYVHRHMFRNSINTAFGEEISDPEVGSESVFEYTKAFDPTNIGYVKENVEIIAFIYKKKPEWEVLQVNEAHLIKH